MVEKIDAAAHRHVGAAFTAVDSAAIRVHRERCAKVRNRNVACLKCAVACTSGCIALVEGELVIDAARCVGCGTCATVCPTCALESLNPGDAELAGACLSAVRDGRVVVGCGLALEALDGLVDSAAVVPVVCAGRVDESLLCTLAARGVREATVLCGRCDRCAQRHGAATAVLVAETAQTLLDAWGASLVVRVTDEVPQFLLAEGVTAAEAARARDDFFAEGRACVPVVREGDAAADGVVSEGGPRPVGRGPVSLSSPEAEAADTTVGPGLRFFWNSGHSRKVASHSLHVMKDGTLPHFVPDRRERLLDALAALGEPAAPSVACRLAGAVVIDGAKCVSCRMCATFCPTGAIAKFDEADGALGVAHTPADCVKCGSCRDICPTQAITILDEVRTDWLVDGTCHRYPMTPRPVDLADNPHQILDTFRLTFNGDIFER
ncbi:4Fe-4S binding protein [Adlercreutzia muris]|uniref:4Fe-4S binding protein n=1 Tax=Adlercreutzia muris TaxID=1796610 RepID=UPI0021D570F0|nr:4Fe-4S binding protein [Adlercreutzia muris]MCU7583911.1 4Fe-4S binding protein [Adlercreutzia muris]